jgi:hypothetical protein
MQWQARCNHLRRFVDSEPKTQTMDLQVEKVINENTNTLEGDVCHYYVDIDNQCEINHTEMDIDRVWLNWVFDWLIDLGSKNVHIKSITVGSSNMNLNRVNNNL